MTDGLPGPACVLGISLSFPSGELDAESQEGEKSKRRTNVVYHTKPVTWFVSAQVQSRHLQAGLVTAIANLHKLVRLNLSNSDGPHGPITPADREKLCQGARSPGFHVLATCTALTQLVLSHVIVREEEVRPVEKCPYSLHPLLPYPTKPV
jgi:hypothetical protein